LVQGEVGRGFRGLMLGPNDLAQVACLGLGATLGLGELGDRRRSSWWFLPMVVLFSVGGLASGARSGLLGVLCGLGYLLFTGFARGRGFGKARRKQLFGGALALIVVGIALMSTDVGRTQVGRMTETADNVTSGNVEVRPIVWGTYLRSLVRRPLFGVGYGNYATMDEPMTERVVGAHASHMALMEYTITTGVPGTLLFTLALWVAWKGSRARQAGPFRRSAALFLATNWPIFLLSTGATGLAQVSGWSFWAPIIVAGAFLAQPREAEAPDREPASPRLVPVT